MCVAQFDNVGGDVHGRCDDWWVIVMVWIGAGD